MTTFHPDRCSTSTLRGHGKMTSIAGSLSDFIFGEILDGLSDKEYRIVGRRSHDANIDRQQDGRRFWVYQCPNLEIDVSDLETCAQWTLQPHEPDTVKRLEEILRAY